MTFLKSVEHRGACYIFLCTFLRFEFKQRVDWKWTYRHRWEPLAEMPVVSSGQVGWSGALGRQAVNQQEAQRPTNSHGRCFPYVLLHNRRKHHSSARFTGRRTRLLAWVYW